MSEYIYASSGKPLANSDGEVSLAREKIVRCRDCKYFECLINDSYICGRNKKFKPWAQLDGFCAWSERK